MAKASKPANPKPNLPTGNIRMETFSDKSPKQTKGNGNNDGGKKKGG